MERQALKRLTFGASFKKAASLQNVKKIETAACGPLNKPVAEERFFDHDASNSMQMSGETGSNAEAPFSIISSTGNKSPKRLRDAKKRRQALRCEKRKIQMEKIRQIRKDHRIYVWGSEIPDPCSSFEELKRVYSIPDRLMKCIEDRGFREPTPIQMQAVPIMMQNRDVMASAPTGSGKTLAFVLPLLTQLATNNADSDSMDCVEDKISLLLSAGCIAPKVLVLEPTREMAKQVFNEFVRFSDGLNVRVHLFEKLKKSAGKKKQANRYDVVVSTPNRLVFELGEAKSEGRLSLAEVRWLIVDESDKLFEEGQNGFRDQLASIYFACSHPLVKRALFSATFSFELEDWCKQNFDHPPLMVCVGPRNSAVESVKQELVFAGSEQGKLVALRQLFARGLEPPILVFAQSKDRAAQLHDQLRQTTTHVGVIHGDVPLKKREETIASFRRGKTWILICTELLGRGLDFMGVNVVVNFDLPTSPISYIHRIDM